MGWRVRREGRATEREKDWNGYNREWESVKMELKTIGESRNGRRKYGKESKGVMETSTVKKDKAGGTMECTRTYCVSRKKKRW